MKTKEEKKKSNLWFMLLVLLLISVILCISSFGIATWARYRSVVGNNVEAQIAKWSFKVNGEEEQFADINLADTIAFEHVEKTTIAPGTYGSFDLDIDGRGSEVSLDYYVDMIVAQKPTNMKFYSDSNYTQAIEIAVGNKMYLEGDLLLSENPMRETRTIYWKWDYRTNTLPSEAVLNAYSPVIPGLEALITDYNNATGAAQEEIAMKINDKIDTQEAGSQVIVNVKVKGVQINPNFSLKRVQVTSAKDDVYQAGDTVNFSMEFTENVYGNNSTGAVTNVNAPVVTVGFGGATASNPVVKVASLMQTNLKLSEAEKIATFVSVNENKINYSYTLQSGDSGAFRIANITGSVYNRDGKEINFGTVQSVPEVTGGTVTTEAPVTVVTPTPTPTPTPIQTLTPTPTPTSVPTSTGQTAQIIVSGQQVTLTKENVADYYGKVVTNYNQANATYRLFYVDFDGDFGAKGTVYLKADQVSTTALDTTVSASSVEALNKMKQMNPQWRDNDGTANSNNELGVLYLCDENNWSTYKDASKADYVIGAPSIEMYAASYNQYHSKKGTSGYKKIRTAFYKIEQGATANGYKYVMGDTSTSYAYWTDASTLKSDTNNLYVKSGQAWWLASPGAYNAGYLCRVRGDNSSLGGNYYYNSYGACPIVFLKSTFTPEFAN